MKKLLFVIIILTAGSGFSQNIMGAYISTREDHEDYYTVTITLDVMTSPWAPAPSVSVNCGDGTTEGLSLLSSTATAWTTHHYYWGVHSYPAVAGTYTITYHDSARVAGIRNMQNSAYQPLEVKTTIFLYNGPTGTYWGVPLSNAEDCFLSGSKQFSYSPGASFYIDSSSYSLGTCAGAGYYVPAGTTFNDTSGLISLNNDTSAVYAANIIIKQWRRFGSTAPWSLISTTQMDFLVGMKGYTGIEQYAAEPGNVNFYPNPFQNNLQLECIQCSNLLHKLIVRNNLGQVLTEINQPSFKQDLDLGTLPAGIYFVEIQDERGNKTNSKVVKE